jgi:hypothetical protein
MSIANSLLGTSETTILSVTNGQSWANVTLTFCNTSSSDEVITVYCYPNGGSASATTTILAQLTIPALDTFIFDSKLLLGSQDKISGLGLQGSKVSVTASYLAL